MKTMQWIKVSDKSAPPYLMGLLGLIPLVGFFVGAALLLYGIFQYRNVKLIVIGIACMLFTVLVYYSLYRFSKTEASLEAYDTFAQRELNALVPHIEFYKMENGVYPDSLQQMLSYSMSISIYDHSQLSRHNKAVLFNYKNLGDRYLLFSSGPDGIPNTADDLFPQVNNTNEKTGWIKNE
jgi:hypothetical protein